MCFLTPPQNQLGVTRFILLKLTTNSFVRKDKNRVYFILDFTLYLVLYQTWDTIYRAWKFVQ